MALPLALGAALLLAACSGQSGGAGAPSADEEPAKGSTWDQMFWNEGHWAAPASAKDTAGRETSAAEPGA